MLTHKQSYLKTRYDQLLTVLNYFQNSISFVRVFVHKALIFPAAMQSKFLFLTNDTVYL